MKKHILLFALTCSLAALTACSKPSESEIESQSVEKVNKMPMVLGEKMSCKSVKLEKEISSGEWEALVTMNNDKTVKAIVKVSMSGEVSVEIRQSDFLDVVGN